MLSLVKVQLMVFWMPRVEEMVKSPDISRGQQSASWGCKLTALEAWIGAEETSEIIYTVNKTKRVLQKHIPAQGIIS